MITEKEKKTLVEIIYKNLEQTFGDEEEITEKQVEEAVENRSPEVVLSFIVADLLEGEDNEL